MKRMLSIILVSFILLTTSNLICLADDAPLRVEGSDVYPITNNTVEMESEVIKIHFESRKVEVTFNFHNTSSETELYVGFPICSSYPDMPETYYDALNFKAFDYPSMKEIDTALKTVINKDKNTSDQYSHFYTWKMHFNANERKSMRVEYTSVNNEGVSYVLKTGALWKDKIGKIDAYIYFEDKTSQPEVYASPQNYYYSGNGIEWHFKNIDPDFDLWVSRRSIPSFFNKLRDYYKPREVRVLGEYKWDKYFYNIDTYEYVHANSEMQINDYMMYLNEQEREYYIQTELRTKLKEQLNKAASVRNEIYARHGYNFKQSKWQEFFSKQPWYKPSEKFSPKSLNTIEVQNIEYIKTFERMIDPSAPDDILIERLDSFINNYNR